MPPPRSSKANASIKSRLFRAKSRTARIILLLSRRGLEDQGVGDHPLTRIDAFHFLQFVGEHLPTDNLDASELSTSCRHVDPVAVMQMKDCRCRNHGMHFLLL